MRPSSWASEAIVSSTLNWFPSGPREKSSVQPTRSNCSAPLGASTTPSTEMYSVTTSLPIDSPSEDQPDGRGETDDRPVHPEGLATLLAIEDDAVGRQELRDHREAPARSPLLSLMPAILDV